MHMKRFLTLALSALLAAGLLTACGGTSDGSADTAEVSLSSFYAGLAEEYGWTEDAASSGEEDILMMDVEGDLLESYYPGLADVATEQLIAKAPMMSAVVNEIVLAQCATEEDAAAAASILQDRVDAQAEGGAWYPEPTEMWRSESRIVSNGNFVMLVAHTGADSVVEQFNALFA